ncbi:MAG: GDP-mannose 4,6-dehydratase [Planctomycetaceae bacterium]
MGEKTALITGVTGQDGALMAEFLLERGYTVHGLLRRSSSSNTERIDHLVERGVQFADQFHLHFGDMCDGDSLIRILRDTRPDELYNLAAQSHVHVSFATAESTADVNALGPLRLLEAIRSLRWVDRVRFYQASTSEMFGDSPPPQNEQTPFRPRSPYAVAKLFAYWTTVNYRRAYGIHASNGILFNHEGPTRGEAFVTRKITRAVAAVEAGSRDVLRLGNLDARRDWGHARDYVDGIFRIVQHDEPDDFVLGTGKTHSVREFVERAFSEIGIGIGWQDDGVDERGVDTATGETRVAVDPAFFRPSEVHHLVGDASKARDLLGWKPTIGFDELVREMVQADRERTQERRGGEVASRRNDT